MGKSVMLMDFSLVKLGQPRLFVRVGVILSSQLRDFRLVCEAFSP